jgi:hypothetical protein
LPTRAAQYRVTVTVRHAVLPAASAARMVTVFDPTSNAIGAVVQFSVPFAVPEPPLEFDHVTRATAVLSCAVPLIVMVAALVDTLVCGGVRITMEGGVVSEPPDKAA